MDTCTNSETRSNPPFVRLYRPFCVLMATIFVFSGCVVGPDFSQPQPQNLQLDYLSKVDTQSQQTVALNQWWQLFGDSALNSLLHNAQSQNLTLRESYERIVEARANLRLQGGQLRPNGNLDTAYSYNKNSPNSRPFVGSNGDPFNLFDLGIDTTWEIDLFGKIARSIEAADAQMRFEESEYEAIRQTLFADIVSSYLRIRALQTRMMLLEEGLVIQSHTETLVSERTDAGASTKLDLNQTQSFKFRSLALQASLRQQLDIEFNQLSLLMGQSPNMQFKDSLGLAPLPSMPLIPDVGFPADLLRRRPDIRREEMAVREASARIGIAEADLYPQLTLLGSIGLSAQNISGLFETDGLEFAVGPSFQWNIFHFGRICDNIEIQQAQYRQTIARYQNSALEAVREVEDALANHTGYRVQSMTLQQAIQADENAVQLSLERYRAGKANFQRVVDAQQQLLNDQQQFVEMQALATTQLVRLFRAAGGDWGIGNPVANSYPPNGEIIQIDGVVDSEASWPVVESNTAPWVGMNQSFPVTETSATEWIQPTLTAPALQGAPAISIQPEISVPSLELPMPNVSTNLPAQLLRGNSTIRQTSHTAGSKKANSSGVKRIEVNQPPPLTLQ